MIKQKKTLIFILFIFIFSAASESIYAQKNASEIVNENYKFTFIIPQDAFNMRKEENSGKTAITYEFETISGKDTIGVMLLAFKWPDIKKLNDFVYLMEKEVTLDIPQRIGDYEEFDSVYYDGKFAVYKNKVLSHLIYYYRTKDESSENNFTYLLRFKVFSKSFDDRLLQYVREVAGNFNPRKVIDPEMSD
jgi:hypothetical protein